MKRIACYFFLKKPTIATSVGNNFDKIQLTLLSDSMVNCMADGRCFGYSIEDVQMVIENMASQGKEPTFSMGDDTPMAVLSQKSQWLYNYFKQRFAQVTNPAIDPLREGLVMSLEIAVGKKENLLEVGPQNAAQVCLLL